MGIFGIQVVDEHYHIAGSGARFPSLGILFEQALGEKLLESCMRVSLTYGLKWRGVKTRTGKYVLPLTPLSDPTVKMSP